MAGVGTTDPWLASLAGTSKQQIFKLRKGERRMTIDWAERLAPHLGVDPRYLTGLSDDTDNQLIPTESFQPRQSSQTHILEYDFDEVSRRGFGDAERSSWRCVGTWSIPAVVVESKFGKSANLAVLRVSDDAMSPEIKSGDRVVIDFASCTGSPAGIYAISDGKQIVLKRLELLAGNEPRAVRISSPNPAYTRYEREIRSVEIFGRIVARWTWK